MTSRYTLSRRGITCDNVKRGRAEPQTQRLVLEQAL
jgi:hypothetical protein